MAENVEVKAVDTEEPSIQEKEQVAAEKSGATFEDGVYKIDLRNTTTTEQEKTEEDAVQEPSTEESMLRSGDASEESGQETEVELQEVGEGNEETPEEVILQEITNEDTATEDIQEEKPTAEEIVEAIEEAEQKGTELPENIQKVVDFINETGGSLEDYVRLNQDYSQLNEMQLLREYYQNTKPHLDREDIDLLMEDFLYDEDLDDEKQIRKAKIAFKEEVAKAKNHLEGLKSKYYEEIKAGSRLTTEQQKAIDFFNRYNEETEQSSKIAEKQKSIFLEKTDKVFNDTFKGFEYNVGDKRYRFNVKNANEVKSTQSDINNFIKKFLSEDNTMNDAKGYHKSLFTAMNADAIATHFYEQGRADALKNSLQTAKNINMNPRGVHNKANNDGEIKARIVGDDISKIKLKLKNY